MTAIPHPPSELKSILAPLARVAKRQWMVNASRAFLRFAMIALTLFLLCAMIFGHWQSMPTGLRIAMASLLWIVVFFALYFFIRPVLRPRAMREAAFAVEQFLPDVQERVSSAVELSEEPDSRFTGSAALVQRLVSQAEDDVRALNPQAIVPTGPVKRAAAFLAPVLLAWLVLLPLMPRPIIRGLVFTLFPWRSDAPAVLADIAVSPGDVRIAQGDSLDVTVSLAEKSTSPVQFVCKLANSQTITQDLSPSNADGLAFHARPENLNESFQYQARVGGMHTRWFDVTVVPRPSVARLDVHYDYPAYTALNDRTEINSPGELRAIVGTQVTLTIHSAAALSLGEGKSRIALNKDRRDGQDIELAPMPDVTGAYRASFFIQNSGTYRIHLLGAQALDNGEEMWNRDAQPRSIEAVFDAAPTVAITAPKAEETVGTDDTVPVAFEASDDFGVARVEALVQVDDRAAKSVPLDLRTLRDRRQVREQWMLSVADQIASAGATEATKIAYQLKAIDNRDPDPQSALSARQTLIIRKDIRDSIATRMENERAQKFQQAIEQAVQKLDQARPQLEVAKNPAETLKPEQARQLEQAQEKIAQADEELAKIAEENVETGMKPVAERAERIAEEQVRQAAENSAKAALNPAPQERAEAATRAQQQIDEAKKQLAELKQDITKQQARLETARLINQAERIQEQVAAEQARLAQAKKSADANAREAVGKPKAQQEAVKQEAQKLQQQHTALQQRQQEAIQRVQQAVQKEQGLQNAQAAEDARKLAELAQQVTQLRQDQVPTEEQLKKQSDFNAAQKQAADLAAKQEELNREINRFARKDQPALQLAPAQPPNRDQLNNILTALRQPNVSQAAELQKQVAEQLAQNAEALNKSARQPEAKGPAAQQSKLEHAALAQKIQQANQAAQQAAHNLTAAEKGSDMSVRAKAQKAAQDAAAQLTQLAQKAVNDATEADKAADAAREQARDAAAEAQAALKAAEEQAASALQEAQAAAANAQSDPQAAQKAAEAQKTVQARKQAAEAMQNRAEAQAKSAEQATKAADGAQEAAAAAKEAAETAQANAPFVGKAADVAEEMKKAGNALKKAAEQNAAAEQARLAHAQQHAADEAAQKAAELANKQAELAQASAPLAAQLQQTQQGMQNPADLANQQRQVGQREEQAAQAAAQLQQATAQRNADFSDRAKAAEKALKEAATAQAAVADAQAKVAEAQQASQKSDQEAAQAASQASQAEDRANQAEAQAEAQHNQAATLMEQAAELLRDSDSAKAAGNDAQAAQLQQQAAQLEQQSHQAEQATKAPSDQAAEAQKAAETASKQAGDANAKAAAAEQQAHAAQQASAQHQAAAAAALERAETLLREPVAPENSTEQLASSKSPEAGDVSAQQQAMQQAAQNVQEAAQAQQQAFNSPKGNAMASAQAARALQEAAEAIGTAVPESKQGKPADQRTTAAHIPRGPSEPTDGTKSSLTESNSDDRPTEVKEFGISPADWARLGPLAQKELLNAAQQSGPPAYREQIKNYFVKIARLRSDTEAVKQ